MLKREVSQLHQQVMPRAEAYRLVVLVAVTSATVAVGMTLQFMPRKAPITINARDHGVDGTWSAPSPNDDRGDITSSDRIIGRHAVGTGTPLQLTAEACEQKQSRGYLIGCGEWRVPQALTVGNAVAYDNVTLVGSWHCKQGEREMKCARGVTP